MLSREKYCFIMVNYEYIVLHISVCYSQNLRRINYITGETCKKEAFLISSDAIVCPLLQNCSTSFDVGN